MRSPKLKRPILYDPYTDSCATRASKFFRWSKSRLTLRSFFALVCIITVLVYAILRIKEKIRRALRWIDPPPLYGAYHAAELALPQHDQTRAFDRGQKYLWVNNHVSGESVRTAEIEHNLISCFEQVSDGEITLRI